MANAKETRSVKNNIGLALFILILVAMFFIPTSETLTAAGRNSLGLLLCWMHIRWQRRRHYFCSQFVSEVLQKSGALDLPKPSTLMHPSDYAELPQLRCLYRGTLADLPQRQSMEMGEVESVMGLYLNVLLGAVKGRVRRLF